MGELGATKLPSKSNILYLLEIRFEPTTIPLETKMTDLGSHLPFRPKYRRFIWTIAFVGSALLLGPSQARSEYRLSVGDTLEILVSGAPELQRRMTINLNGEASFPLIGEVNAAEMTLSELRQKVRDRFSQTEYRRPAVPGSGGAINSDQVSLNIVEYRPIYLTGDIAAPGERIYKPGMSIRQAISIAGGFDIARSRMSNALLDSTDLRGQYESLSTELTRERVRAQRIQIELGRTANFDEKDLPLIAPRVLSEIMQLEEDLMKARKSDLDKEKGHLRETLALADSKIASLTRQYSNEEEGMKLDSEEMARVKELFSKGLVPATRLLEARRSELLSATRALQTNVQLEETKKNRQEVDLRLKRIDDQRRIMLFDELQNVNLKIVTTQAKAQAAAERLFYLGAAKSQMVLTTAGKITIVVFRTVGDKKERITADEDTQVVPGDVIEVSVEVNYVNQFAKKE
jgi:polysaccharide export outer membrane protein